MVLVGGVVLLLMVLMLASGGPKKTPAVDSPGDRGISAKEIEDACALLRAVYGARPESEIPMEKMELLRACRALGK